MNADDLPLIVVTMYVFPTATELSEADELAKTEVAVKASSTMPRKAGMSFFICIIPSPSRKLRGGSIIMLGRNDLNESFPFRGLLGEPCNVD